MKLDRNVHFDYDVLNMELATPYGWTIIQKKTGVRFQPSQQGDNQSLISTKKSPLQGSSSLPCNGDLIISYLSFLGQEGKCCPKILVVYILVFSFFFWVHIWCNIFKSLSPNFILFHLNFLPMQSNTFVLPDSKQPTWAFAIF